MTRDTSGIRPILPGVQKYRANTREGQRDRAQRQGIGTLVTLVPLLEARSLGCHAGVLQATEQGRPVYQRLGFTEHFRYHLFGFPAAT